MTLHITVDCSPGGGTGRNLASLVQVTAIVFSFCAGVCLQDKPRTPQGADSVQEGQARMETPAQGDSTSQQQPCTRPRPPPPTPSLRPPQGCPSEPCSAGHPHGALQGLRLIAGALICGPAFSGRSCPPGGSVLGSRSFRCRLQLLSPKHTHFTGSARPGGILVTMGHLDCDHKSCSNSCV